MPSCDAPIHLSELLGRVWEYYAQKEAEFDEQVNKWAVELAQEKYPGYSRRQNQILKEAFGRGLVHSRVPKEAPALQKTEAERLLRRKLVGQLGFFDLWDMVSRRMASAWPSPLDDLVSEYASFDERLREHCGLLVTRSLVEPNDFSIAIAQIDTGRFVNTLLRDLWREYPTVAAELGLPKPLEGWAESKTVDNGDAFLPPRALAKKHNIPDDRFPAFEKLLERWRKKNVLSHDFTEHDAPSRNQPRFLYREAAVRHLIYRAGGSRPT